MKSSRIPPLARSLRATTVAACAAILFLSIQCKREERTFYTASQPADVSTVGSVQLSTLVPGTTSPSTTRAATPIADYEGSAYQMAEGQKLFAAYNCSGCHANGGGGMGPPLIDDKWIYGHEPEQVFATIVQGRPNGMPAFGKRLPAEQIWQLTAYVRSMSGQVRFDAAPSRNDQLKSAPPPNTIDTTQPVESGPSKSAERPS